MASQPPEPGSSAAQAEVRKTKTIFAIIIVVNLAIMLGAFFPKLFRSESPSPPKPAEEKATP